MNGAFIVSGDDDLFQRIERALVADGGSSGGGVAQVNSSDGTLFTVYGGQGVRVRPERGARGDQGRRRYRSRVHHGDLVLG
jgi:hypothetical protein